MSLLTASIRVPSSLHNELPASSSSVAEGNSLKKSAPLLRRNASLGSFKKAASVHHKFQKVPRLQVSARLGEPVIRRVAVQVAHELINAGHHCLDVRTVEEFNAGHVEGAVNIPYLVKCGPGMSKNHRFLEEVKEQFGKDDEIIVGCQSGRRSMMAATELLAANFTGITDMGGGYLAWKESGLPTKNPKEASKNSV